MIAIALGCVELTRSGRIVNLSSVAGRVTMPGAGAYAASKYAIEALSDALRFEASLSGDPDLASSSAAARRSR